MTALQEKADRVWVRDEKNGFVDGKLLEKKEGKTKVLVRNDEVTVPNEKVQERNPSIFDACEDMAMLSFLNEASVLFNLKERFRHNLIHSYAGLFCITVNPWRWLPIYSPKIVLLYKGQPLNTMPPHIYAVADSVYNHMMEGDEDQSILITGESGAGKTENTKKIMQYFTIVAAHKYQKDSVSLEEQICETNPVLEVFGNAKSAHNDNSSRFGKFIEIAFGANGKVCKAVITCYMLEKSRVISQANNERCFHIFYQLLSDAMPLEWREKFYLTRSSSEYRYLKNGVSNVDGMDDEAGFRVTQRGLKILGFSKAEQYNIFQVTAGVLLIGQIKFRAKHSNNEQTSVDGILEAEQACTLLGIDTLYFLEALTEPTVTVRGELVKQNKNVQQVVSSVNSLAKSVYERLFHWLVKHCNGTLTAQGKKGVRTWHFVGILDISGFEIFTRNSFEQLCINYTNEKLQYLFNHHMFVREQEEYEREQLHWEQLDFALDLKPTIDLIEKPMGILSMLDEECIMPKGSEGTFLEKLMKQHQVKSPAFAKPKGGPKARAHFAVEHYAGLVNYNVDNWLDKNKDPVNHCAVQEFKRSRNELVKETWADEPNGKNDDDIPKGRRATTTVSAIYLEQLSSLLSILNRTHPHFVRCVVPNHERRPVELNSRLCLRDTGMAREFDVIFEKLKPYGRYNLLIFLTYQWLWIGMATDTLSSYTSIGGLKPEYICHDPEFQNVTDTCLMVSNCTNLTVISQFYSIYQEFEWACINMALPYTLASLGYIPGLLGFIVAGQIADRWGRKWPLFSAMVYYHVLNVLTATAPTWQYYLGVGMTGWIVWPLMVTTMSPLTMETVGKKYRLLQTFSFQWTLSYMAAGFIAYLCRNWRVMILIDTAISAPTLIALFLMQESPRWLIQKQRYEDAAKVLNRIAFWNGQRDVHFTAEELTKIEVGPDPKTSVFDAFKLLRNKKLLIYTVSMAMMATSISLVWNIVFMNIQDMAGSPFINAGLLGALRIWSPIAIFIERKYKWFGRKLQLLGSMVVVFLCFGSISLIYVLGYREMLHTLTTAMALFGFAVTISLAGVAHDQMTIELYPTTMRATGQSVIQVLRVVGSMAGPQLVYLREFWPALPYLGVTCIIGAAVTLAFFVLPETRDRTLPDTFKAAVDEEKEEKESLDMETAL